MNKNDLIQITNDKHPWFPAILVVDEVKTWGVQAFIIVPKSNDGSIAPALAYNRIETSDFEKVGQSVIIGDGDD